MDKCASKTEIDKVFSKYTNFYVGLAYINTIINPNQQNHLDYYFNMMNYIICSRHIGVESYILISEYNIHTDDSILPFESMSLQKGFIVEGQSNQYPFTIASR